VLLVGGLAFMVTTNRQRALIDEMLRYTLSQDRTGEVDPCAWLFVQQGDQLAGAEAAPPGLPLMVPIRAAAAGGATTSTSIRANGTRYFLRTERTADGTRQAVFDARYQISDRHDLFTALVVAEIIGLLIAVGTGVLLARLAIAPLDEALRRQRRFVADASHELRTPLTRLYTRAQMLLLRRGLPPEVDAGLRHLVQNSRELNDIVDDLLRSAVLSAGRPTGNPVDLAAVAETVVDAEQPRAAEAGIVLRTSYERAATDVAAPSRTFAARAVPMAGVSTVAVGPAEPAVGPAEPAVSPEPAAPPVVAPQATVSPAAGVLVVAGVESALRRMVSALVDNALRHSFAGGHVTVTVAPADRGRMVTLVVADDGTGLDPADSRRIFERFHRGTPVRNGSHGLGLALVREVVEAHGGDVTATGRPGAGTDFVVRLPAYAAAKPARRTADPRAALSATAGRARPRSWRRGRP